MDAIVAPSRLFPPRPSIHWLQRAQVLENAQAGIVHKDVQAPKLAVEPFEECPTESRLGYIRLPARDSSRQFPGPTPIRLRIWFTPSRTLSACSAQIATAAPAAPSRSEWLARCPLLRPSPAPFSL